jgi:hypothetical protein
VSEKLVPARKRCEVGFSRTLTTKPAAYFSYATFP